MSRPIILSALLCTAILFVTTGCQTTQPRTVRDFDFDWKFLKSDAKGAQAVDFDDSDWRNVQVPHDWGIEGPFSDEYASGTGYLPGSIGWYRKTFQLDTSLRGKKIFVEFDGIYNNSEVWINGKHLGNRPFGYISFQYDMTPYVNFGKEDNVLAVRVDHSQFADSRWYTGSGIYRHVRMTATDPLHIRLWGIFVTTPVVESDYAKVQIQIELVNESAQEQSFELVSEILDALGQVVAMSKSKQTLAAGESKTMSQESIFRNPRLWSPDSPVLYTLKSQVRINNVVIDEQNTPFGIRTFRFDLDKGFFLNGSNMKLKGVCLHHDGGPVGAAVPEKIWKLRFEKLKAIGCNAIRCSHNPPAPEFLDLCDEMGFLVMDEAFDEFTPPKKKWIKGRNVGVPDLAGYGEVFEEWAVRDIQDMVRRDRNHPSIILWSIGNEIDYPNDPFSHPADGEDYNPENPPAENIVPYAKMLVNAVKQIDTTRPVTAALANAPASNETGYADTLDIVGYNYQEKYYQQDHAKYPNRVLYGSENNMSLGAWQAVANNDYISGQFLWTGIDYLGESPGWPVRSWTNALFDLCNFKKPLGWFRQSLWSNKPMVYIGIRSLGSGENRRRRREIVSNWNAQDGQEVRVICYTNCDQVELLLNGTSLGSKPYSQARRGALSWTVPFAKGMLKAVGKRSGKAVCEYSLQTADPAKKIALSPDTTKLAADGKDVCCVEFYITDENDVRISDAENEVTFTVTGPAKLIGIGNGNPASHESHQDNIHNAWQGRGLAVVRAGKTKGTVIVEVSAQGLDSDTITLQVR